MIGAGVGDGLGRGCGVGCAAGGGTVAALVGAAGVPGSAVPTGPGAAVCRAGAGGALTAVVGTEEGRPWVGGAVLTALSETTGAGWAARSGDWGAPTVLVVRKRVAPAPPRAPTRTTAAIRVRRPAVSRWRRIAGTGRAAVRPVPPRGVIPDAPAAAGAGGRISAAQRAQRWTWPATAVSAAGPSFPARCSISHGPTRTQVRRKAASDCTAAHP